MENCDITRAVLEAEEFIDHQREAAAASLRSPRAQDRFLSPQVGGQEGITMGPALSTVMDFLQISKVSHEFEHSLFGPATCNFCKVAFLFLQYYMDKLMELEEVKENAKMICRGIEMLRYHVCAGMVDSFAPELLNVLSRTNQSPENICGFMFGEACDNPAIPEHEWDILLPSPTREVISPRRAREVQEDRPLVILHVTDTHWDPLYREGALAACKDFLCCREESGQVSHVMIICRGH